MPKEVSRQREAEAWKLRQQCWTLQRIADHLGVAVSSVHEMLQRVEKRLWEETKGDWIHKKVEHEAQLGHLIEQALLGWQKSLEDAETYKETNLPDGSVKQERTMKGQSGNAAHLANARAMLADIRAIYGMDAAPKMATAEQETDPPPDDVPKDDATKAPIDV